jgi:WD40 repeat protein
MPKLTLAPLSLVLALAPSIALAQGKGEEKRPADPSAFPPGCTGFLETKHTKLAGVWGRYESRHSKRVNFVVLSPDDRRALTGSEDNSVRLWDLTGAAERLKLTYTAYAASFSPDGRRAVLGVDGRLVVVDLILGKELKTIEAQGRPVSIARSDDGKTIVYGNAGGETHALNLATGDAVVSFEKRNTQASSVAFSSSGKRVLEALAGSWIYLSDLDSGETVRMLSIPGEGSAVFSGDRKLALASGKDRQLLVVDLATGESRGLPIIASEPLALSGDGAIALGSEGDAIIALETAGGNQLRRFRGPGATVSALALTHDGKVAVGGFEDGLVRAWDLATGAVLTSGSQTGPVAALAASPDGSQAIVGGNDGIVRVWDAAEGRLLRALPGAETAIAGVALVGSRALSVCGQGVARTWDLGTGELLHCFDPEEPESPLVLVSRDGAVAVSPYLVAKDDGTKSYGIAFRDLAGGGTFKSLGLQPSEITALALSADAKLALAANADMTLGLWDVRKLKLIRTLTGHMTATTALAFSPDGKRAWTGSTNGTIKVWDVATGDEVRTFEGHVHAVSAIAISPDGTIAVTASTDGLTLWDTAKLAAIDTIDLSSSEDDPRLLAFAGNTRFLVGTGRGVVLAFDMSR